MNIRRIASTLAKSLLITSGLLVIIIMAGVFVLPSLLKSKLPQIIQQETGSSAAIADLQLSLFPPAIKLQGFAINEKNHQTLAAFDTFYIKINALKSLTELTLFIDKIWLDKPFVHIARQQDGAYNFAGLIKNEGSQDAKDPNIFPINITKLFLTGGKLAWDDAHAPRPVSLQISPIQLNIDDFSSTTNQPARVKLTLSLDAAGDLDWQGTLGIRPLLSQGRIAVDKLPFPIILALSGQNSDSFKLLGNVSVDTDYQLSYAENALKLSANKAVLNSHGLRYEAGEQILEIADFSHKTDLTFSYAGNHWQLQAKNAQAAGRDIRLQDRLLGTVAELGLAAAYKMNYANNHLGFIVNGGDLNGKALKLSEQKNELVNLPAIALRGIEFNLNDQELKLDSMSANDAAIKAWLNADGSLNYQAFMPIPENNGKAAAEKKTPWFIKADSIALNNSTLAFEDKTLAKPFALTLKPVDFKLTGFSNQPDARLPFQLDVAINKTGLISAKGNASLSPFAAQLTLAARNIELEKFQAYYDRFIRLDIIDGLLNIDGQLILALQEPAAPDVKFNGNVAVADFLTRDLRVHKDFVKWENLNLQDIALDLKASRYTASTLRIDRPYARVTIRKDKSVNVADVMITGKTTIESKAKKTEQKTAYFKLDKVLVSDGSSDFTDLSLILPFSAHIKSLDGGASGISSENQSTINASLKGNAYDLAPVDITAKINPYLGNHDVQIKFSGLPMPLVSPYMVQFAGYKVEKGKMSLTLNYQITDKQLTASNKLLIDQFELGEKVDNPNAVSIPLKLAIALLKDAHGKIKFDVPITGSLENPQFSIAAIVRDAVVNAIGKVVTSPFHALASLVKSHSEDLSTVNFSPGSSTLDQQQETKLSEIAAALQQRPKLTLNIKGMSFQQQDWPAISDDALYDQLKIRRTAEINQLAGRKIRPEYVELSKEDYRRLLAAMFIEKFPALAEHSLLGIPSLKAPNSGNFYEVAKQKLQEIINPEQERLKDLASARAQTIAKYLVKQGKIAHERVYILDTVIDTNKDNKEIASLLSLKAD